MELRKTLNDFQLSSSPACIINKHTFSEGLTLICYVTVHCLRHILKNPIPISAHPQNMHVIYHPTLTGAAVAKASNHPRRVSRTTLSMMGSTQMKPGMFNLPFKPS